jgi:YVTN family beta-propeller protein
MTPGLARLLSTLVAALYLTHADASMVMVLNSGEGTVSLIDRATMQETAQFSVGKEPHHLMVTPDGQYLIVANAVSNDLAFLDPLTSQLQHRKSRISDPYQIGFSPDHKYFVALSFRLHRVDIYDGKTLAIHQRLRLKKTPSHLAFDQQSTTVFVSLQDSDTIAAIDLRTLEVVWHWRAGCACTGISPPSSKTCCRGSPITR